MLVMTADTATLNPSFSQREIDRAFRDDPVAARSEYGRDGIIEFRSDVSTFVTEKALAAVVPTECASWRLMRGGQRLAILMRRRDLGATRQRWGLRSSGGQRSWRRYAGGGHRLTHRRWHARRPSCVCGMASPRSPSTDLRRGWSRTCFVATASRVTRPSGIRRRGLLNY